jgi:hypothetical protein
LANNAENPILSSPNETKLHNRKRVLIAVVAIAIASLIIGSFTAAAILSKPTGKNAWLFKGAYAKYEGSTSIMGYTFDFSAKLEVLDFNSTHAYLSTSFNMSSNMGQTAEETNSTWVPLSQVGFANAFGDSNVTSSYETTLDFGSLGTRTCIVYEIATGGPTMDVYVDKTIGWPLRMKLSMVGEGSTTLSLDINLANTNIPGLK